MSTKTREIRETVLQSNLCGYVSANTHHANTIRVKLFRAEVVGRTVVNFVAHVFQGPNRHAGVFVAGAVQDLRHEFCQQAAFVQSVARLTHAFKNLV